MEVDTPEDVVGFKEYFNGAVPMKRARMDLTTTTSDAAQLRKRKEAEKVYGRGRKIPGDYQAPLLNSTSPDINSF
jgi:U3 small nucleolar RNA-associated protein 7